jgi:hypothetical protein
MRRLLSPFFCSFIALTITNGLQVLPVSAAAPTTNSIKVSLFGQPCLLEGPFSASVLGATDAISPGKIYPEYLDIHSLSSSVSQARRSLETLQKTATVPAGLDRYRERATKRLQAQMAFLGALEKAIAAKKATPMVELFQQSSLQVDTKKKKDLAALAPKALDPKLQEQLFELFNDAIEADPEEEFHRAIRHMNIKYVCSFEESGEESGEN